MPERVLRLFVSSPSDVAAERERVRVVADRLNGEFEGVARIDVQRWEDAFYTATASFQEAIDKTLAGMSATDIVVCIVWKRAGLKLNPAIWHRPDGSAYESGTVLEFETAVVASRKHEGVPDVYLFHKTAPVLYQAERAAEEAAQHQLLQAVIKRWTQTPEGYNTAGSQPFSDPDDFEHKLEGCLRQWLERRGLVLKGPVWDRLLKGSPFRGLDPFDAEHAPVFFGREAAIERATARLRRAPFLLVLGVSGTGKSSLLRAGLLPRLSRAGVIPGVDLWRTAVVLPAGDPLASLAHALFAEGALGAELRAGDFSTPQALAGALAAGGDVAIAPIRAALARLAQSRAETLRYETPRPVKLLLAVDQAERLFVEAEPARIETFAAVLRSLVEAGLASLIAALRSDTYGRFQQVPSFLALREAGETLDLPPSSPSELEDMVTRPVAACQPPLAFEVDSNRRSLAEVLVTQATGGDALPLLQMTLQRLYEKEAERSDGVLRFADYPGMDGAVTAVAEQAFQTLEPVARAELPALLTTLVRDVGIAPEGGRPAMAVMALVREDFERKRPARKALIDAFIAHRLLTPEEVDGIVRVRPVHEALLRAWPEAVHIIAEHAALIRVRRTLEPMAADWARAPADAKSGYTELSPALLAGAERLSAHFGDDLGAEMRGFIAASIAADVRRRDAEGRQQRRRLAFTAGGLVIALVLAGLAAWQWREAAAQKRMAEEQRGRAEKALSAATGMATALTEIASNIREQGNLGAALAAAERSRSIFQDLSAADPTNTEWQHNLAVSHRAVGDVLYAQGALDAALDAYRKGLAISEKLASIDPGNRQWGRDLSLAYNKVGDVLVSQGKPAAALEAYGRALTVIRRLASADPSYEQPQNDLSASYLRIGDVLADLGKYDEALKAYRISLEIAEKLAADPANVQWQRDLSVNYSKIGDLLLRDRRADALDAYRKSLAIVQRLADADPANSQLAVDVAASLYRLAMAGDEPRARLTRALDILRRLDAEGKLTGRRKGWIEIVEKALAALPPP